MKIKFAKKWKWLAMDADGSWCRFTNKPTILHLEWTCNGEYQVFDYETFEPAKNWRKSRIRINK